MQTLPTPQQNPAFLPALPSTRQGPPFGCLPQSVASALWCGDQIGAPVTSVVATGFDELDAELPGGGWPCRSLTELLQFEAGVLEWRLIGAAMRQVVARGQSLVVIGPPRCPHLPGLRHLGIDERHLVWIQSESPSERLWVTEQVIRANAAGLLICWLPQVRQAQMRRLQVGAQACDGPVFVCRPAVAGREPSAAPLRLQVEFGLDWELHVHLLKRKGPTHEGFIHLPSVPGGLASILTPRLLKPSTLIAARAAPRPSHVVGSPAPRHPPLRPVVRPGAAH